MSVPEVRMMIWLLLCCLSSSVHQKMVSWSINLSVVKGRRIASLLSRNLILLVFPPLWTQHSQPCRPSSFSICRVTELPGRITGWPMLISSEAVGIKPKQQIKPTFIIFLLLGGLTQQIMLMCYSYPGRSRQPCHCAQNSLHSDRSPSVRAERLRSSTFC